MAAPLCLPLRPRPLAAMALAAAAAVAMVLCTWAAAVPAQQPREETLTPAEAAYREGFALQQQFRTPEAIQAYERALQRNPFHGKAHYEIGWSYWVLRDWEQVVRHWEVALQLEAGPPELPDYLATARERLSGKQPPLMRVAIGERAEAAAGAPLSLKLAARFQHYDPHPGDPADRFDRHVFSPKSVIFSRDGAKAYVNALEGKTTLVYDARSLAKLKVIHHRFGEAEAGLFDAEAERAFFSGVAGEAPPPHPSRFEGKPVEAAFTHGGRYLWISYYRRDYDRWGTLPSAVAVIDTARDEIVRVLPTGPIPKSLAVAPSGTLVAVVHWGNNTVGLITADAPSPSGFRHVGEIVVEKRLEVAADGPVDRDHYCGFCLRGGVFSPDGRWLLVGRMGGGGIAVLDVAARRHVGTVWGMRPTPRHLLLAPDGERLYISSSASGYVSLYRLNDLVAAAREGRKRLAPLRETAIGRGGRTIALAPDGDTLYAAVNRASRVVALDAANLTRRLEIAADSFPVGLAVSPDGRRLWVTSQGIALRGGNSVSIYDIEQ